MPGHPDDEHGRGAAETLPERPASISGVRSASLDADPAAAAPTLRADEHAQAISGARPAAAAPAPPPATGNTGGEPGSGDAAARGEPPPDLIAGRYQVVGFIGAGGYGAVYKAVDQRLQKTVAVKLLSGQGSRSDQTIRRFRVEALAASRLSHPAIVAVTDFDVLRDGRPFLVMEYVVGETLDRHLSTAGPLDPPRAARIARLICSALAAAHRDRVVHRDLKPANVILGEVDGEGTVKILDFGVAKLAGDPEASGLTGAGWLLGTPAYMAPEQIDSEVGSVDGRADVYALGIMLYEMLTGRNPYTGRAVTEALMAHLREDVPRPSQLRPEVPRELDEIVLKATRRKPAERYEGATAMGEELAVFLKESASGQYPAPRREPAPEPAAPAPARRRLPVLLVAAALLLGGGGLAAWWASRSPRHAAPPAAGAGQDGAPAGAPGPPAPTGPGPASAAAPAAAHALPAAAASQPAAAAGAPVRAKPARAAGPRPRDGRRPRLPDAPTTTFKVPK